MGRPQRDTTYFLRNDNQVQNRVRQHYLHNQTKHTKDNRPNITNESESPLAHLEQHSQQPTSRVVNQAFTKKEQN